MIFLLLVDILEMQELERRTKICVEEANMVKWGKKMVPGVAADGMCLLVHNKLLPTLRASFMQPCPEALAIAPMAEIVTSFVASKVDERAKERTRKQRAVENWCNQGCELMAQFSCRLLMAITSLTIRSPVVQT